jgi:hypothetical protein
MGIYYLVFRGVGVAGLTLGGGELFLMLGKLGVHSIHITLKGYSWKSNQHGLTVDTVVSYELVRNYWGLMFPSDVELLIFRLFVPR